MLALRDRRGLDAVMRLVRFLASHASGLPATFWWLWSGALLSALVVKGSFFILLRLWFSAMPGVPGLPAAQVLAAFGAAAILFGSVLALREARLKMLVAYSTVAQLGYLFLMFPLAASPEASWSGVALEGGVLQAVSHAFAKAAMFMATGLIDEALGHDRIAELGGVGRALPMTVLAFGLAGLSLMGVPPSGGFAAKLMLLRATLAAAVVVGSMGFVSVPWQLLGLRLLQGMLRDGSQARCPQPRRSWPPARCPRGVRRQPTAERDRLAGRPRRRGLGSAM